MAEYIEREALTLLAYKSGDYGHPAVVDLEDIADIPSADVVPVVHCRDCKHITPAEGGLPLCALHNIARAYNDFCSDGTRLGGDSDEG